MNPTVTVERTDCIPEDASVRHYDELSGDAKQRFPTLVADVPSRTVLDARTAGEFTDGEVVVFTGYYRVGIE